MKPRIAQYARVYTERTEEQRRILAKSDLLFMMCTLDDIAHLRGLVRGTQPNIVMVLQPQYVLKWNGQPDWWEYLVGESLDHSFQQMCFWNDWYLHDPDGRVLSDGGITNYVNWTPYCPRGPEKLPDGRPNPGKDLRASQWYMKKLVEVASQWRWDSGGGWNGLMFEVLVDCLGSHGHLDVLSRACPKWPTSRATEGVYDLCGSGGADDPLSIYMKAENGAFYRDLCRKLPDLKWFMNDNNKYIGPWWRSNGLGRKLENWIDGPWKEWMFGDLGHTSYFDNRDLEGSDWNVIYILDHPEKSRAWNDQRVRYGLGSTLLGDGLFCYASEKEEGPLWHPLFDIELGEPLGPCYRAAVVDVWMRQYEHYRIVVNPSDRTLRGCPPHDALFIKT